MTNHALAIDTTPPLVELLSEQFSERELDRLLDLQGQTIPWAVWDEALYGPLADFLARPGKEFRARLVDTAWELAGRKTAPPAELRWIVEVLHAGSLIVDDIEDDSSYRRGELALHKKWGLGRALNAGSWLYFWSDWLIERLELAPPVELAARRLVDRTLLRAHQGQALDLSTRVYDLAQADVPAVVTVTTQLKSGALMQLATSLGAVAAAAHELGNAVLAGLRHVQVLEARGLVDDEHVDADVVPGDAGVVGPVVRQREDCLLYTSPSPRDRTRSRMPSSS